MNLFTEKEFNNQSQHFAFRLRNLYLKDKDAFYQIQDYLPFPIYINERKLSNYHFFSNCFFNRGVEIENLYEIGKDYLEEISNPFLLQHSIRKAKIFDENNDFNHVCSYLQEISMNKKMTPFLTNKILINDHLTLNTTFFPLEFKPLNNIFRELIPIGENSYIKWQKFQTLSKREKEILKLIIQGCTNNQIADTIFISTNTVRTHRNRIWKKLEINHFRDCLKYQPFFDFTF